MSRYAAITGRYLYLTVQDVEYRVYIEESGAGVPVVLQHTAGCDNRQWRHLLESPDVTGEFRLIAPDLPFHGKSVPPTAVDWWNQDYTLRQDFLIEFHLRLADALELDRPIYVGCSMGGHLGADLALSNPERYRAVVCVEAALHSHGMERILPYLYHPEVGNDVKSGMMYTFCSPTSPEEFKRETAWLYSQGAPSVFKGDLEYYFIEHDLTETARTIDTSKIGVWILSAQYDWTAPPAAGALLAAEIEGSHFVEMQGVGHFPMSENPEAFERVLLPILREAAVIEHMSLAARH